MRCSYYNNKKASKRDRMDSKSSSFTGIIPNQLTKNKEFLKLNLCPRNQYCTLRLNSITLAKEVTLKSTTRKGIQ